MTLEELERYFINVTPPHIRLSPPATDNLEEYVNMDLVYPDDIIRRSADGSSIYIPAPTPTSSALDRMDPPTQRVFLPRPIRTINVQALQEIGNQVRTWLNTTYPNPPRGITSRESTPYPPAILHRPEHTAYISPTTLPSNMTTSDSTPSTTPNNNPPTPVQDPWANQPTNDGNGWPEADQAEAEHTRQAKANWDNTPNHHDRHGRRLYSHPYAREKALAETPFHKTVDRYLRVSE